MLKQDVYKVRIPLFLPYSRVWATIWALDEAEVKVLEGEVEAEVYYKEVVTKWIGRSRHERDGDC